MTSRTGSAQRILGIWREWVEMRPALREDGWFSLARGDLCGGCHTCWWGGSGRWKSQNRKIVPLSPYVEEPLNSKVIKFRTWTEKSSSVFCVSRFLYSVLYIYGHSMYVSHIAISWLWYINTIFWWWWYEKHSNSIHSLDFLLTSIPIGYHFWLVFSTAYSIHTDLMNLSFCWSGNTSVSMCWRPSGNVAYEFVHNSPAISNMSCSFWMVCAMKGKWLYSWCLIEDYFQDLFGEACII